MTARILYSVALLIFVAPLTAQAQETAKAKAARFLGSANQGRSNLSFLHFGATYLDHNLTETGSVTGRDGKPIPGAFYLEYTYDWKVGQGRDQTTITYYFNGAGNFTHSKVDKTSAIFNQPFALADLSIVLLGNVMTNALGDKITDKEKAILKDLVDNASSQRLMEFGIAVNLAIRK